MDNQREHNASNVPTQRNLELENKKLKDEIERKDLHHQIEKLKLEKEIMELKSEIKIQKLVYEKENLEKSGNTKGETGKFENEKKKLKKENVNLATNLLKQYHINRKTNLPKVITNGDRFIEGISRYIEGVEPETNEYDSYTQWYDDISKRVTPSKHKTFVHPKYVLIQEIFEAKSNVTNIIVDFTSHNTVCYTYSNAFHLFGNLSEFWTNENTKSVFILHPKNPEKSLELFQNGQVEQNLEIVGYKWRSSLPVVFQEFSNKSNVNDCGDEEFVEYPIILCAIKH